MSSPREGHKLLEVRDLRVHFPTEDGVVKAVDGSSFALDRGETLGVVGESGSGKSITFLTVMGLINRSSARISGSVLFEGEEIIDASAARLRDIRGKRIGMIFQDPMTSLHPMHRVGDQIAEVVLTHTGASKKEAARLAVESLAEVGMPSPETRARQYPHEFSGGMRQRAMIAMALVLKPSLLIADEPTTALDVTIQAQILELIDELKEKFNIGVVLVSHSLATIADVSQDVMVMYAGRPAELGARDQVFQDAQHPYTWGLLESVPRPDVRVERLIPIDGQPPSLITLPPGCAFSPRCRHVRPECTAAVPELRDRGSGHLDACIIEPDEKTRLREERLAALEAGA